MSPSATVVQPLSATRLHVGSDADGGVCGGSSDDAASVTVPGPF